MADSSLRFFWVRHAPPVNPDGLCYGQKNIQADLTNNKAFRRQAALLPDKAVWVSSPLSRAFETASKLAKYKSGLTILRDSRLMEQSFGHWQEMRKTDLDKTVAFSTYIADPANIRPPGGESLTDLKRRTEEAVSQMLNTYCGKEKNIVVVCHGGTIRSALSIATGLGIHDTLRVSIDPLSISTLRYDSDKLKKLKNPWTIEAVNTKP